MSDSVQSATSSSRSVTPAPAPSTKAQHNRAFSRSTMERFTFTLGKLDAGMAILLGPNAHILEFPSLLLPTPSAGQPPLGPGSILTITVSRDLQAEKAAQDAFQSLQADILSTFSVAPTTPKLKLRNVTQTSVCVEWDPINLGSATMRGLEMYRNGQRWGRVGEKERGKKEKREWKTGGLQSGEEYTFQLVLKTTAGTHSSNLIRVQTHTMDNLTGLYIKFGPIQPPQLLDKLRACLEEIGARESPTLALDTTHFVCTTPLSGGDDKGRGTSIDPEYSAAIRANLPVVGPDWLFAVAREKKLVSISNYLLPPPPPDVAPPITTAQFKRPEPLKKSSLPFTSSAPSSPILSSREEPSRSPSPETIARMSMTGPATASRSNVNISDSFERRGSRDGPINALRRGSREGSLPLEPGDSGRPRSPKPETDGKLDRGFKFPLKIDSPAASPTMATGAVSASTSGSINPDGEATASDKGREVSIENQTPGPFDITPAAAAAGSSEPAALETPSTPVVTVTPPDEAQENPMERASHASTIDEAVAEFHEAMGKPKEEQAEAGTRSGITPVLTPVEEILAQTPDAVEKDASASASAEAKGSDSVAGPQSSETIAKGHSDEAATAPSKTAISHTTVEDEADDEGDATEGNTMDEIDLN